MKKRILVVDDEAGILKILRIQLKANGYEVITTQSSQGAVALARSERPDVVLLDVFMPVINGLDVLKQLRAFSKVPVIVFSASPQMVEEAMKIGANGFIPKPFHPELIGEKIEAVLGGDGKSNWS